MATTGVNARGLVPARRQDGQPPSAANMYPTGSNRAVLMLGDAVYLNADRKIQRWDQQVSANAPAMLGAVIGLFDENKKPLTHVADKRIGVSASGYVLVVDDPDCLFEAEILASVGPSDVGKFVTVVTGAPVTANGMGGQRVASPVVTAAGHPLQIYRVPSGTELDSVGASANNVLVRISNHTFRRSTRLQGPLEGADA